VSGWARRRTALAGIVALVALVIGLVAATSSAGAARYRTTTAVTGDVEQTVGYDGTITASRRRDLSFGAAGTIASVKVEQGEKVKAGQVLARLDTTDLAAAVTDAKADLASAEATLEDVKGGQVDALTSAASSSSAAPASTTGSTGSTGSLRVVAAVATKGATVQTAASTDLSAQLAALAEQQTAVTSAQTAATEAIAAAKDALASQTTACAASQSDTSSTDSSTGPATDPAAGISEECTEALAAVQDAQDVVAEKQAALQSALGSLSSTLDEAIAASGKSTTGPASPASPSAPSGQGQTGPKGSATTPTAPGSASGSPDATDGSGRTATAADLASAQAAVDVARAELIQSEADLDASLLTAPFAGTVQAVDITAGDDVATTDRAMVLIGAGDTTATISVPVDELAPIKVGQEAHVLDGTGDPIAATVSSIGLAPESSTDGSSATYEVTVTLDDTTTAPEGATVRVEIVTATATKAVTVPASAITPLSATTGTLRVLKGEQVSRTRVTLGARGDTAVAITDGLDAGDLVVLADLEEALPSGGTQTGSTLRIGGSGAGVMTGPPPGMGTAR
jgi:multidrug efflux pump subunit AcrA (membrane-fusion protein)